jgi:hypothetical protein
MPSILTGLLVIIAVGLVGAFVTAKARIILQIPKDTPNRSKMDTVYLLVGGVEMYAILHFLHHSP